MSDFSILVHRTGESLHLKLLGEFDQRSAREVISAIKSNQLGISRVFLHTNGLNGLDLANPQELLGQIPALVNGSVRVFFTGEYSPKLAPKGCELYKGLRS